MAEAEMRQSDRDGFFHCMVWCVVVFLLLQSFFNEFCEFMTTIHEQDSFGLSFLCIFVDRGVNISIPNHVNT
jgi:hypothetical protein